MGEIVVKVPPWMERILRKKIEILVEREIGKGLRNDVLSKYLGRFKGDVNEEAWYLQ